MIIGSKPATFELGFLERLMARILSLVPGNRTEPTSLDLIRRTFLTPPALGNANHGLPAAAPLPFFFSVSSNMML
ncbi:MAG: hypothetical protein WAM53_03435 [Terrimicrobiaceae bacterium]|jgi:hypothetical protein